MWLLWRSDSAMLVMTLLVILVATGCVFGAPPSQPFDDDEFTPDRVGDEIRFQNFEPSQYSVSREYAICKKTWENKMLWRGKREDVKVPPAQIHHHFPAIVDVPSTNAKQLNQSVLFIHVGKSCGNSVTVAMDNAGVAYTHLHLFPTDEIMIKQHDYIIIGIREPLERTVSAFNFAVKILNHHNKKLTDDATKFYKCFQHVEKYAHALYENTTCGDIARMSDGRYHINWDTCSYMGGVMEELVKKKDKVFLVNTRSCSADLQHAFDLMGWKDVKLGEFPHVHGEHKDPASTTLSIMAQMKLRGYLETIGEYDLYRALEQAFTKPY